MHTINKAKTKEHDKKWRIFTNKFYKIKCDEDRKNETYQKIILGINKIEKIEQIIKLDITQSIPDIQEKLVFELNKARINVSFEFVDYLASREEIESVQQVEDFYIGIDCLSLVLLYYGYTLMSLEFTKLMDYIKRATEYKNIWQNINKSINDSNITLLHENSLRLIYTSIYILEDTHRYRLISRNLEQNQQRDTNFKQEEQIYDSLLADMETWSQEEWSQEELEAYAKAMSNL